MKLVSTALLGVLTLSLPMYLVADVKEYVGLYRTYENFDIFWPCNRGLPHYVLLRPEANDQVQKFLEEKHLPPKIKVLAEITNEKKNGMDGTAVIHRVLEKGKGLDCPKTN